MTCNVDDKIQDKDVYFCFCFKYDLEQKYHAPQVRPEGGSNSWPPDHDNTFHVTDMPAPTTQPSVTEHAFLHRLWIFAIILLIMEVVVAKSYLTRDFL